MPDACSCVHASPVRVITAGTLPSASGETGARNTSATIIPGIRSRFIAHLLQRSTDDDPFLNGVIARGNSQQ